MIFFEASSAILLVIGYLGMIGVVLWVRILCWWMNQKNLPRSTFSQYWWIVSGSPIGIVMLWGIVEGEKRYLGFFLFLFLVSLSITDVCCYWLPDFITYGGILFFSVYRIYISHNDAWIDYFLASILAVFITLPMAILGYLGWGDVKLLGALGWMVGMSGLISMMIITIYSVLIFLFLRILVGDPWSLKRPLPFAPALSLGGFVAYILPEDLFFLVL